MSLDSSIAQLPPELIEKLRETGIRLDRNGRFWHDGGEITHERFRNTLLRWMDMRSDGRVILRFDDERYAYIDVEETPLLVTSVRWDKGHATVKVNDGTEEELQYQTLVQSSDNTLYCLVRGGTLRARITTPAYYQLAEAIEPLEGSNSFGLRANGHLYPIAETSQ